jgi:osmotically-inducible protein OsmY
MRAASLLLLAIAAPTLTGGCAALAVAGAAGATVFVAKDRTLGEGVDETTAGAEVRTRLLAADFGAYSPISVEVSQGRLLLAGDVPTMEHKIEAERIAWRSPAVRRVENNLQVGPRADVWRGGWDAWIAAEIRTRFLADDDVKGINFNVEAHRGVVYLMGVARRPEELRAAAEIARRVNGVEKVVSYVEVLPVEPEARAAMAIDAAATPSALEPHSAPPGPTQPLWGQEPIWDAAAPQAPPTRSSSPAAPSGRRLEVRYPDEADARPVAAEPPRAAPSDRPRGVGPAGGAESQAGLSGFGRAWSTPRQTPPTAPAAPPQGAPLLLSQR